MSNAKEAVGQRLTAKDIKDRLIQDGDEITLLMWPPNLFAFTSYVFGLSGAYQLAVSPPSHPGWAKELSRWPPSKELLNLLFDESPTYGAAAKAIVARAEVMEHWMHHHLVNLPEARRERLWTYAVRECGQEWRDSLPKTEQAFKPYCEFILSGVLPQNYEPLIPVFLRACWEAFTRLCYDEPAAWDIAMLLCNDEIAGLPERTEPDLLHRWLASVALLSMHAIADETCVGWGVVGSGALTVSFPDCQTLQALTSIIDANPKGVEDWASVFRDTFTISDARITKSSAQLWSENERLHKDGTLASINPYRGRVLPKRHTPDVGITLRSISSNLAFHRSAIEVVWNRQPDIPSPLAERMAIRDGKEPQPLTILLLPLPLEIKSSSFEEWQGENPVDALSPYGFFRYQPAQDQRDTIETIVGNTLLNAQKEVGAVDMVVLPESSIDTELLWRLERRLAIGRDAAHDPVSFYVAGVAKESAGKSFPHDNCVYFKSLRRTDAQAPFGRDKDLDDANIKFFQHKHHRWQLNQSQLNQYGLTHCLPEGRSKWWEAINVGKRRVSFINIGERLTVCPLICEDLARQDPIADLIRHVGPSLVVTILMDGPQLKDRWSSRYAGILSEDPGSAVIALTSYGMVRRWSTPYRPLSQIVALWNDRHGARELELEQGAGGILLSVRVSEEREPIADGRLELHATSRLELIDVIQIPRD